MEPHEHHLTVQKTARYYSLEPPDGVVKSVWFVIHGYRQLAKYFIRHFAPVAEQGVLVIAPEGLHRFYIEGYSGRVGASWMTREDRETDIGDYVAYLNNLYSVIQSRTGVVPVHLLGFSQGGPTACRWLAGSEIPFRSLMLYATVFPDDFDFEANKERLRGVKCLAAFGDNDPFASEEVIRQKMAWMHSRGIVPGLHRFRGGHDIVEDVLLRFKDEVEGN